MLTDLKQRRVCQKHILTQLQKFKKYYFCGVNIIINDHDVHHPIQ